MKIKFLGHAGFKIINENIIYIDPFKIRESETGISKEDSEGANKIKADIIFITHEHYDHCSIEDLKKIAGAGTAIVAPFECKSKLENIDCKKVFVKPGEKKEIKGVAFEAVHAYNIGKPFHTKETNKVGYIIELDGKKVYHAGDTDLIPEMRKIKTDVALLPIGGTYTMNPEQAAKACELIKPGILVPMHYGSFADINLKADTEKLKKKVSCKVEILKPGEEAEV